ncbi:hypothetical protein PDPE_1-01935 [Photobacterium damselae subsp. piscicida]|nr:hypothetical protein EQ875_01703 [Photobacterium damselae subsp. damselae]BBC41095.1 hypothetical protein PDPE_1-01935 [Photobacterium damselae subsp. piscicida]
MSNVLYLFFLATSYWFVLLLPYDIQMGLVRFISSMLIIVNIHLLYSDIRTIYYQKR